MTLKIELQGLIDWLRTKPADGEYTYSQSRGCLVQQYITHLGGLDVSAVPDQYSYMDSVDELSPHIRVALDPPINMIAMDSVNAPDKQTFGAALERALKLQASGYVPS